MENFYSPLANYNQYENKNFQGDFLKHTKSKVFFMQYRKIAPAKNLLLNEQIF